MIPSISSTGSNALQPHYAPWDARALSDQAGRNFANQMTQYMQANAASANAAQGQEAADKAAAEANWQKVIGLTEGRGNAVLNDPYTAAALQRLQGVTNGQDVPFTAAVQNQMLARQADAGASAMDAQRQMIESQQSALGGSMADPSAQAALRRLLAQNQAHNNANLGDIQTKAQLTNFGARNDAAMNMANLRGQQLGQANGQFNQAAGYYANRSYAQPHQSAVGGGGYGSYGVTTTQLGGGGSQAPAFRPTDYLNAPTRPAIQTRPQTPYGQQPWTPMPQPTPYPAQKNPYGTFDPSKPVY